MCSDFLRVSILSYEGLEYGCEDQLLREELQYATAAKVLPPSSTAALLLPRCSESAVDSATYLQMKG